MAPGADTELTDFLWPGQAATTQIDDLLPSGPSNEVFYSMKTKIKKNANALI